MAKEKHVKGPERVARAPITARLLAKSGSLVVGGVRLARAPSAPHPKHIVAPVSVAAERRSERSRADK